MSAVSNGAEVGTARHATSRLKEEFYLKRFRPLTATAGSGGGTAVTTAPEPEKSGANTPAGSRGSLTCAPEAQAPGADSGAARTTVNSRLMTASCRSGGSGMERPSSAVLSAASCPVPVRRESPNTPQHKPPRPPRHDSTLVSFDSRPRKSTDPVGVGIGSEKEANSALMGKANGSLMGTPRTTPQMTENVRVVMLPPGWGGLVPCPLPAQLNAEDAGAEELPDGDAGGGKGCLGQPDDRLRISIKLDRPATAPQVRNTARAGRSQSIPISGSPRLLPPPPHTSPRKPCNAWPMRGPRLLQVPLRSARNAGVHYVAGQSARSDVMSEEVGRAGFHSARAGGREDTDRPRSEKLLGSRKKMTWKGFGPVASTWAGQTFPARWKPVTKSRLVSL